MVEYRESTNIRQLSFSTAHLLSSGQIITTVTSAIKELIENGLDAKAKRIDVKLEDSGLSKIEVRDDGTGVCPDDVAVMAKPQYTSKIVHQEDIDHCNTYGFRGEALSALCAISDVQITTKTVAEELSMIYTLDCEGNVTGSKPTPLGQGTTICCQNLFKNVPVRKSFYVLGKRKKEDVKKCEEIMKFFGVLHPEVRFSLSNDGCLLWQKPSESDVRAALVHAWGSSLLQQMEEHVVWDVQEDIRVSAYLPKLTASPQSVTKKSPEACWLAVNRKPVVQKEIIKVLHQGYSSATGSQNRGRYPVCFVHLQLASGKVDINLEPNKDRLLFLCKESVISLIKNLIQKAYGNEMNEQAKESQEKTVIPAENKSAKPCSKTSLPKVSHKSDLQSVKNSPLLPKTLSRTSEFPAGQTERSKLDEVFDINIPDKHPKLIFSSSHNDSNFTLNDTDSLFSDDDLELNLVDNSANGLTALRSVTKRSEPNDSARVNISNNENKDNTNNNSMCLSPQDNDLNKSGKLQLERNPSVINDQEKKGLETSDVLCRIPVERNDSSPNEGSESNSDLREIPKQLPPTRIDNWILNPKRNGDTSIQVEKHTAKEKEVKGPHQQFEPLPIVPTEKWTLGQLVNNSSTRIEPVKLVTGLETRVDKRRASPEEIGGRNSSLKKKRLEPGQPRLYDIIASQPVRRPNSPFAFFCKEHRAKVVAIHSGAKLSEITDILLKKFKELSPEEKERYKSLAEKDDFRYQSQIQKVNEPKVSGSLTQKPAKSNKKEKYIWQTITVPFSLQNLNKKSKSDSTRQAHAENVVSLVGQLEGSGSWIGVRGDNQVVALNPFRMKEALLYYKLREKHVLDTQPLLTPTPLNKSVVGDVELWNILMNLSAEKKSLAGYLYITDPRITSNGFNIGRTADMERVEIVDQNQSLPYYGLSDLKAVLQCIRLGQTCLSKCRPLKVQHYLQGEAVRMVRQMPSKLSETEITELIQACLSLPDNNNSCIHNKPFLHHIYDLISLSRHENDPDV